MWGTHSQSTCLVCGNSSHFSVNRNSLSDFLHLAFESVRLRHTFACEWNKECAWKIVRIVNQRPGLSADCAMFFWFFFKKAKLSRAGTSVNERPIWYSFTTAQKLYPVKCIRSLSSGTNVLRIYALISPCIWVAIYIPFPGVTSTGMCRPLGHTFPTFRS